MKTKSATVAGRAALTSLALAFLLTGQAAHGQVYCPPRAVPTNPAPLPGRSGSDCIIRLLDNLGLEQEGTRTVTLERGRSYWFAANGCPKMGRIQLQIVDQSGTVVKQDESYSPSFCYTARASGKYTIRVKALSLMGRYTSGTIDACLSHSRCKE